MRVSRLATALLVAILLSPCSRADQPKGFGPLYDHFKLTLGDGERTEAAGPFYSLQRNEAEEVRAMPPLWSSRRDPATDSEEIDVLYPLFTWDRFGLDYRVQFLQFFSVAGGSTMEMSGKKRTTIFPIYFRQQSADPKLNYTAVVPFYGHLKNRLFRDEISFVMLPLYVQTQKRDVVTDNYLLPLFHLRHGDALSGWQFWPLMGQEHKDVMTRTNQYDDLEIVGGHDKLFVLWPLFIRNNSGLGTTNLQRQLLSVPFYAAQRSPTRDSTTYLWPVGYTYTDDRARGYEEWDFLWPSIQFARGEGKTLNRIWPLFSVGHTPTLESDYYLWPLYKYSHLKTEPLDRARSRVLFYLYSDLVEQNTAAGTTLHRTDLWPLFTARQEHNGNYRLQLFAPLEPVLPTNLAIERNYSLLWSIWRSEKNAKTGASSQSFLWNLYRRDTTSTTRKSSLLFGLFRYQSTPEGRQWRVFFVPINKSATASTLSGARSEYVPEHR
jgi:hypothetical protein